MTTPPEKPIYDSYHAHIYFDASTLEHGRWLTEAAAHRFELKLGRLHEKPVGPHPCWSRQLAFSAYSYRPLLDWLEDNRQGLTILIHGNTGNDLADHTEHASWLGAPVELLLEIFQEY